MDPRPTVPADEPVGLPPDAYLAMLRLSLRRELRGRTVDVMRELTDSWVFDGVDPFEPLSNGGWRTIRWDYPEWHSIAGDLSTTLAAVVDGDDWAVRLKDLPADLACYVGYVALELSAHHDPLYDVLHGAVFRPLIVAARKKVEPTLFRRYLIGLFDRRNTLDKRALNHEEVVQMTALGVALGSTKDPVLGQQVRWIRGWLGQRLTSGTARFRDIVPSSQRSLFATAVEASAGDVQTWVATFMK